MTGFELYLLVCCISVYVIYNEIVLDIKMSVIFSSETYMYGAVYLWNTVALCIGAVLANVIFVPIFYPLQLTSINKVKML